MLHPSKIDWADLVYNPVTGCLHECPYCYARKTAKRFCNDIRLNKNNPQVTMGPTKGTWILEEPFKNENGKTIAYPIAFEPTLHSYRLDYPSRRSITPAKIFVGSDSDIFGSWIPDEWIVKIFDSCKAAPWNKYLFLTKNPKRYLQLGKKGLLLKGTNIWYGMTFTKQKDITGLGLYKQFIDNLFLSIEPLHEDITDCDFTGADWVIVGAETGNRTGKITVQKEWIENIITHCKDKQIPYFLKDNLKTAFGETLVKQYPENIANIERRILAKNRVYVEQVQKNVTCMYCEKALKGLPAWRMNAKAYCCNDCLEDKLEAQKHFVN